MLVVSGNFGGGKLRHICEVQVHLKVLKDYNRTHKVRVRVRVRSRCTSKCSRTATVRTRSWKQFSLCSIFNCQDFRKRDVIMNSYDSPPPETLSVVCKVVRTSLVTTIAMGH